MRWTRWERRVQGASWPLLALVVAACGSENDVAVQTGDDTFQQAPSNEVDILWVVDNSCSMTEEQDTLARGFGSFTGQMEASATDFHIGVISTSFDYADPERGQLLGDPPYLTIADDYVSGFVERAQMGIAGSDKEKGLEAAAWALSPTMTTGPNAGFLRQEAQLLIVIVSDEEDCSDEGALEGQPAEACYTNQDALVPYYEFVNEYRSLKSDDAMVQVGAIVGVKGGACDTAYATKRYSLAAASTGGLVGDICLSDWSSMLTELGLNATGVRTSFQLSDGADPASIEVVVDNDGEGGAEEFTVLEDPVTGWTYDPATWFITFGEQAVPERGASITVKYTIDPDAPDPG